MYPKGLILFIWTERFQMFLPLKTVSMHQDICNEICLFSPYSKSISYALLLLHIYYMKKMGIVVLPSMSNSTIILCNDKPLDECFSIVYSPESFFVALLSINVPFVKNVERLLYSSFIFSKE